MIQSSAANPLVHEQSGVRSLCWSRLNNTYSTGTMIGRILLMAMLHPNLMLLLTNCCRRILLLIILMIIVLLRLLIMFVEISSMTRCDGGRGRRVLRRRMRGRQQRGYRGGFAFDQSRYVRRKICKAQRKKIRYFCAFSYL